MTTSYADSAKDLHLKNDLAGLASLTVQATNDPNIDETSFAVVAGLAYDPNGLKESWPAMVKFTERFPDSLHLIRVYMAEALLHAGEIEQAGQNARIYLRIAKDHGLLNDINSAPGLVRQGIERAYLVLWPAYAYVGALSHAVRILEMAAKTDPDLQFKTFCAEDSAKVKEELKDPAKKALDVKWEKFFHGAGAAFANEIMDHCVQKQSPLLAKRVELLNGDLSFGSIQEVGAEEVYRLIYQSAENAFLLK